MSVDVVQGRLGHVLALGRQAKPSAMGFIADCAGDVRQANARLFRGSRGVKTLLVEGRPIAAYGLVGALLAPEAMIWLMVSPDVRNHLRAFAAACQREFAALREAEPRLTGYLVPGDEVAERFAARWGFEIGGVLPSGARMAALDFAKATD
jgi:hypothetical protein